MIDQSTPVVIGRRYRLMDELGSGGMGTVYRAVDRLTGQMVALKRVNKHAPEIKTDEDSMDVRLSMAQEFRLLASLRHPNVIAVADYGFDDDQHPYFTMDLLDNAQTVVEAGINLDFEGRLALLVQILQALT